MSGIQYECLCKMKGSFIVTVQCGFDCETAAEPYSGQFTSNNKDRLSLDQIDTM